jgi:glycosyltransferase involved in cell wall biosynthesis
VQWHVITPEYPPHSGGVSDYTYTISQALANCGDQVHIWTPGVVSAISSQPSIYVHSLPAGFGWRGLPGLERSLRSYPAPLNLLIQYVPHGYGWKSMNLAFCLWIFRQRHHNVRIMFHEVAFPFRAGQRWRHTVLAVVHRMMAWMILRSARQSFTSTDQYLSLLRKLGTPRMSLDMLRICSNVPSNSDSNRTQKDRSDTGSESVVGVFSGFGREICETLEPAIAAILRNPGITFLLIGPAEMFLQTLVERYPMYAGRISTTGRLHVSAVGEFMRRCDVLLQLFPGGACASHGSLIAALASGIPVVTAAGLHTDQILLESGSLLFAGDTPASIRESIESLLAAPAAARAIGTRARRLYEEYFRPEVIVGKLRQSASEKALPAPEPLARSLAGDGTITAGLPGSLPGE